MYMYICRVYILYICIDLYIYVHEYVCVYVYSCCLLFVTSILFSINRACMIEKVIFGIFCASMAV